MAEPMYIVGGVRGCAPYTGAAHELLVGQRSAYETASYAHYQAFQEHGLHAGETHMAAAEQQARAAPLVRSEVEYTALHTAEVLGQGNLFSRALLPRLLLNCLDRHVLDVPQTVPYWRHVLDDPVRHVSSTAQTLALTYTACALEASQDVTRKRLWSALRLGATCMSRSDMR